MIGTMLQDRYRLDAELGRGGMGVVYRAHDTLLDRAVAVKVLSDSGLGTEGRARLLREARLSQALELLRGLDTRWQIGRTLFELGELAQTRGEAAGAREHFSRALTAFEELGPPRTRPARGWRWRPDDRPT